MMKLEDYLPDDIKEGYRFINKVEGKNYKIVLLYNDEKNMTLFLTLDKESNHLSYFETDYDVFRNKLLSN